MKIPETLVNTLARGAVEEVKREIALKSLDENMMKTPEMKEAVRKLKESWQHSPESGSDIANDIMKMVVGKYSQVQLEMLSGAKITDEDVFSQRLFTQMQVITDVSLLASTLEIIGAIIPTTNLHYLGLALKEYMADTGLTQIVGFGYGMMLSNVFSPLVTYELNTKMRPSLPDPLTAIRSEWKGILPPESVNAILAKHGFSDTYRDALKEESLFYPAPLDLIRFGVRETFREDIVSKYQYDAEYPSDITPYLEMGGLPSLWMKHYWRAHWELPSVQMGYEMLHRGLITLAELNTLIEIADVAPWWRDKLIGISYSPYTRVDVRRLYVDGIITREDVKKNYLEIGYDEKHAENLTVWTCKGLTDTKKETVKDLSESKILLAYTDGEMSVDETTAALEALGYDADEADLLISLTDYTNYKSELTEEYNVLKAEWLAGITDETAAADTMSKLGLSQSEQAKWLRRLARAQRLQEIAAYVKESKAAMKKTEA
jgi:hypothetical protein